MLIRRIKRYVFQDQDRVINLISLIFSVFSAIFSLIVWRQPDPVPAFIVLRDYLIVLSLVLVVVALTARRTILRYKFVKNINHWIDHYRHAQIMLAGYKKLTFGYRYAAVQQSTNFTDKELSYFRSVCEQVTSGAREALKKYIHLKGIDIEEDICITVKLIVKTDAIDQLPLLDPRVKQTAKSKEQWVITAYRDPYTYANKPDRRRNDSDGLYDISTNSAFHDIFDVGNTCYVSNNLIAMGSKYSNGSKDWQRHYNATLVVPIQCDMIDREDKMYFGFLAADSRNTVQEDIYDDQACLIIMQHAADVLANFFMTLSLYNHQPTSSPNSPSSSVSGSIGSS